jgi:hypothetical protein
VRRQPDPHEKGVEWDYSQGHYFVTYAGLRSRAMLWEPTPARVKLWADLLAQAERKAA